MRGPHLIVATHSSFRIRHQPLSSYRPRPRDPVPSLERPPLEAMAHSFVAESHILHRTFAVKPHKVIGARGIRLILESGEEIIDASAGPSVSCLGHSRPDVAQEVARQITDVAYIYSGARFTSTATEELASHLLRDKPGGLSKAIFVNSGSEATDAALKLAFQYWREAGQP